MGSFYAELHVAGHTYPIRLCTYGWTQATGPRGRVVARVRPSLLHLTLDVPAGDFLLHWAATPYQPLAGYLAFFSAKGGPVLETLSWDEGQCVGYQEEFLSGSDAEGAYVCQLTIAAATLHWQAGAPGTYAAPAAGEHGKPQQALVGGPPVAPPLPGLVLPTVEEIAATVGQGLVDGLTAAAAAAALPVALTLALILGSTTPAGGPGIAQPHVLPVDPNLLRLHTLAARHAAGTLTAAEEQELINLLAKVKGIHVQKLSDLLSKGLLRGSTVQLPGFYNTSLQYTKRTDAERISLRRKYDSSVKKSFLKKLSGDPSIRGRLKSSGLTDDEIDDMADGIQPDKYQVHHKLPLDDGGDNSFGNLVLIKNEPYHKSITNLQISLTKGMKAGDTRLVQWPTYPGFVYP